MMVLGLRELMAQPMYRSTAGIRAKVSVFLRASFVGSGV